MSIRSRLGNIRRNILVSFCARRVPLGHIGPVVTFCFDDFPRTAADVGGRILEKYGARGTFYVAAGLMGTRNEVGELCQAEDLQALLDKGHELGTQTFRHSSCRAVPFAAFERDVLEGMEAVERITGHNSTNFAYPYGDVTLRSKRLLGPALTSSRSVIPGLNGPMVDLNLLRANRLYGDTSGSPEIADLISENARHKSWLIFYTHDLSPTPSEYGCTPELFEFAVSAAAKNGSRILTIGGLVSEILPGDRHGQ